MSNSYETCPGDNAVTETAVTATQSSAAIAHGLVPGQILYVVVNGNFNITFGASTINAPGAGVAFTAGLHKFRIKKGTNTHYRITAGAADIKVSAWHGSLE